MLAPKSGKLLRRDLRKGYGDAIDAASDWADEAKDRARDVSDRVRDVASRGAEMAEDLRDTVRGTLLNAMRSANALEAVHDPMKVHLKVGDSARYARTLCGQPSMSTSPLMSTRRSIW